MMHPQLLWAYSYGKLFAQIIFYVIYIAAQSVRRKQNAFISWGTSSTTPARILIWTVIGQVRCHVISASSLKVASHTWRLHKQGHPIFGLNIDHSIRLTKSSSTPSPHIQPLQQHLEGTIYQAIELFIRNMFSSSVRRAARAPSAPFPVVPRPCKSVVAAAASSSSSTKTHQRRYSSSKPNDGSRGFDASSQTPGKSVNPAKEGAEKREGRASKRKGKDGGANGSKHAAFPDLPSVPSTQHIHPNG